MTTLRHVNESDAIRRVTETLIVDFAGRFSSVEVTTIVERVRHQFDEAHIREFVPVMVERIARRELKEPGADHRS